MNRILTLTLLGILILHLPWAAAANRKPPSKQTWAIYYPDGHCEPLATIRDRYPQLTDVSTPQALTDSFRASGLNPLFYPINDPSKPLKGFTITDVEHHISLVILEAKQCPHAFDPTEQDTPK